jgi:hypothetical protein
VSSTEESPKSWRINSVGEGAGIRICENAEMVKKAENKKAKQNFFMIINLVKYEVNQNKSLPSDKVTCFACIVFEHLLFHYTLPVQTSRRHFLCLSLFQDS